MSHWAVAWDFIIRRAVAGAGGSEPTKHILVMQCKHTDIKKLFPGQNTRFSYLKNTMLGVPGPENLNLYSF